jgi:hypothetical protein
MTKHETSDIRKTIMKVLSEEKPRTVKQLVQKISNLTGKEQFEIYNIIQQLEKERIIKLGSSRFERIPPKSLTDFFFKSHYFSIEFWTILLLTIIFFLSVLLIQENSPFSFVRIIFGSIFGFFIPGWVIVNLFFPRIYEKIDQLERVLIAMGVSIGISIFTGLILNDIWIINSLSFVITLGSLTIVILALSTLLRILIVLGVIGSILEFFEKLLEKIKQSINRLLKKKGS